MSYYDYQKNQFISVPSSSNKYFTNNDAIETFYDGPGSDIEKMCIWSEEDGKFSIGDARKIFLSIKNRNGNEGFTSRKIKGFPEGEPTTSGHYNEIETFGTSDNKDPIESNLSGDKSTLGKTLNSQSTKFDYNAVLNGDRSTVYRPSSDLTRQEDSSWSADTTRIPDNIIYQNPQGDLSKQVFPLPPECTNQGLNPYDSKLIKSGDEPNAIYIDGRKMEYDGTPDNCGIIETSWLQNKNMNVSTISPECYEAIPKMKGLTDNGKVNCKMDLRPSEQVNISNKLLEQSNKYSTLARKASLLYNTKTAIAASKYGEIEKVNTLMKTQNNNSDSNNSKLEKLDNSIYSQQRQVQISNDESRRKNENLFLLKILLTYLLIISIPLLLKRSFMDNFKTLHVILVIIFISLPFLYIIGWNLYSIRNRSPMRWPLRNWPVGTIPDGEEDGKEAPKATCAPVVTEPNCQEEAELLESEIDAISQQKRDKWQETQQLYDKEKELGTKFCNLPEQCTGSLCKTEYDVKFTT